MPSKLLIAIFEYATRNITLATRICGSLADDTIMTFERKHI